MSRTLPPPAAGETLRLVPVALVAFALAAAAATTTITDAAMPDDAARMVWYAIRTAGILAYLVLWLTTVAGLCVSGGFAPKWGAVFMPVHQLADLALSLALLHAALLLGDRFAGFTPETLVIPFRAAYEPVWTGCGIIALYLGAAVYWSIEIRPRIGYARWRALHHLAFAVFVLALMHGLFAGTDSASAPMRIVYAATGATVGALTALRIVAARRATPASPRRAERRPAA